MTIVSFLRISEYTKLSSEGPLRAVSSYPKIFPDTTSMPRTRSRRLSKSLRNFACSNPKKFAPIARNNSRFNLARELPREKKKSFCEIHKRTHFPSFQSEQPEHRKMILRIFLRLRGSLTPIQYRHLERPNSRVQKLRSSVFVRTCNIKQCPA